MKTVNRMLGLVVALALSLNFAFANTPAEAAAGEPTENAAVTGATPLAEPESVAADQVAAPKFGEGMQIPVDGTSLDAFEQSLADIKTKATNAEYTTLINAIDYLMVYYIDARRDRTKLAMHLNGKTGEQIIGMVAWGE